MSYYLTDENGEFVRPMVERDLRQSINRARCQCGQKIGVNIQAQASAVDPTKMLQALVGTQCATAEVSIDGQFRRCGELARALASTFTQGVTGAFHPAFLAVGVDPSSPERSVDAPETIVADICDADVTGEAGLWMCDPQENGMAGCQPGEFFITASQPALKFDFMPPLLDVTDLTAESGNGAVELHWEAGSGDVYGFRVLCEEADTGASPGLDFPTPELGEVPDGNHYFTAGNLCGDQPFSTVMTVPGDVSDPDTCGNGVVEAGEACDDGFDNDPEGLCDADCKLRVSPAMHALDWDYVCSDHIAFAGKSATIHGLENGKAYNFVLVSYDLFGNPRAHQVVTATPGEDLPDLDGDGDGDGGGEGCGCVAGESGGVGGLALSLGMLLGLARRRRR
ncbi:hypothetical protein [Nannocystis punicea]|uniref:Myxococcus cysteine-rich repeat-containing protein n=1 Tax=Nannocystis punicea TaxID=2995304 RepID=A0ABY7GZJ4_9BACT|nr:hypothetical protein [Nannocystis poenicansa]WAS92254.1 hypothetical protein O0S08_39245 [Nannocystis poenicansa]